MKQEFTLTVEVFGDSEDDRLEQARLQMHAITETMERFAFFVEFEDIEEDEDDDET